MSIPLLFIISKYLINLIKRLFRGRHNLFIFKALVIGKTGQNDNFLSVLHFTLLYSRWKYNPYNLQITIKGSIMKKHPNNPTRINTVPKYKNPIKSNSYEEEQDENLSLEEDVRKLEDENRRLKQGLREAQRESTLFKSLSTVVKQQPPFSTFAPYLIKDKTKKDITESAILILSDSHGDQEVLGKRVQDLEEYNFDVACSRAERIVDVTISHLKENMAKYNFERLYIIGLGDYVSGEIHKATEHSKWKNSLKNAMGMGELLAMMITDLSRYFPEIVFTSVSGNHGRRSVKKDYRGAQDNWDYMVACHAATRLQGLIAEKRLKVFFPDAWSMGISIYDWNFLVNHGDPVRSWNSIPWYGIERRTRRLNAIGAVTGNIPNYFFFGHFHNMATQQHTCGETIINGSWLGTDEFALESLGAYSEPFQWLMGVHPQYGITWRMPIKLRGSDWRKTEVRTGRYAVTIFEDYEKEI